MNNPNDNDVVCFNTIEDQIVPERSSPDAEMLVSFDDRKRAGNDPAAEFESSIPRRRIAP